MRLRLFIIDTNVLVAGLITGDPASPPARILDAMLDGGLPYLLSPALLEEYRTILLRPKLRRAHSLTGIEIDTLLTEIVANAIWREPPNDAAHPAPDSGDEHLWTLLANEPSSVLVTGDRLLLENPRTGSAIVLPAGCLHFLQR